MRLTSYAVIGFSLLVAASSAHGVEPKQEQGQIQGDMNAMMETYAKLAEPGEPHKQLSTLAGSWYTKTKSWMDPSQPPMQSKGACEHKMILGGRFLQAVCTGEMMGSQFTGIGVTGYDNHTKKYVETWMDSMGTGIYYMDGPAGSDPKVMTMEGTMDDPMEGPMKLRTVTKLGDNNTHVFEMYGTGKNGQEMKMLEITYTRKK
jgi:uncharacterized protein DUF1579